jgi:hypothetical protein
MKSPDCHVTRDMTADRHTGRDLGNVEAAEKGPVSYAKRMARRDGG